MKTSPKNRKKKKFSKERIFPIAEEEVHVRGSELYFFVRNSKGLIKDEEDAEIEDVIGNLELNQTIFAEIEENQANKDSELQPSEETPDINEIVEEEVDFDKNAPSGIASRLFSCLNFSRNKPSINR